MGDYLDYAAEDLKAKGKGLDVNARTNVIDRLIKKGMTLDEARIAAAKIMKKYETGEVEPESTTFENPALTRSREGRDQYRPEDTMNRNFWDEYFQRQ